MKNLKAILFILTILLTIAIIVAIIVVRDIKYGAMPKYEGELIIPALDSEVTVYMDEKGMPHIYASDEHDLYFSVGYVMAQERLWQMDLIRRTTTGRLSEIFGKAYVETDLFLRSLEMTKRSGLVLKNEDPVIISYLQAYVDGVNTYIKTAWNKLPPEFRILSYKPEPWSLEDIASIYGYLGWDLASDNLTSELFYFNLEKKLGGKARQLIPDWKEVTSIVFPDFKISDSLIHNAQSFVSSLDKVKGLGVAAFSGSNSWAVSGNRTGTGKPILSNDMHLGYSSPGIWFQMHQIIPGKLNVTGVVAPGQPFILGGHNEKIAWGMTNLMVDNVDLFAEKINPKNERQYFFNGEWKNMTINKEIIKIKGDEQDTVLLKFTHRGPIISGFRGINDISLSMKWSGYDSGNEFRAMCLLNRAQSWDDFREAISSLKIISQNIVFADNDGNIGLNTAGGIAVRKGNGAIIRNGDTDEYDWKGYVPFEQLPYSFNPGNGSVSVANNKTVEDGYPYYISTNFSIPYRINRIRQMLDEKKIFSIDDFKRMILDQQSDYAALLTPFILKLNSRKAELTAEEDSALSVLNTWNYDMNSRLVAPAIFEFFCDNFIKNLLADELGDLFSQLSRAASEYYIYRIIKSGPDEWVDNINTVRKETIDDIIMKSFKDCVLSLSQKHGTDQTKWKWGCFHKITIEHPLGKNKILDYIFGFNSDEFGIGGCNYTVCQYAHKTDFKVCQGASERHIFNTSNWDESYTIIPTGASGIVGSEFYLSQTKAFLKGEFYKDPFSDGAVRTAAKYTLKLKPDGK